MCAKLGRTIFPELVCWCFYFEARKKAGNGLCFLLAGIDAPCFTAGQSFSATHCLFLQRNTHTLTRTRTLPATHGNLGRLSPAVEDARSDRGDARDIARESACFPPDAERSDQPAMREQLRK